MGYVRIFFMSAVVYMWLVSLDMLTWPVAIASGIIIGIINAFIDVWIGGKDGRRG